jgi:glycosyltransferase involved in cell wall biosynthesis
MNKQISKISIVIPIKLAVDDFANLQKNISNFVYKIENVELILIFDGDEKQKVPNLANIETAKIVRGNFGNPGAARNAGLQESTGEWIWFVDSDDIVVFDDIDALILMLKSASADIYVGQYLHYLELENKRHIHKDAEFQTIGIDLGIWRMVFKREIINEVLFPELSMGEDQVFVAMLLSSNPKLQLVPFPIYEYWQGGSHHLTANQKPRQDILKTNRLIKTLMGESKGFPLSILKLMYMKQLLTIVKYFPFKEKFKAILLLLQAVSINPNNLLYIINARGSHRENR